MGPSKHENVHDRFRRTKRETLLIWCLPLFFAACVLAGFVSFERLQIKNFHTESRLEVLARLTTLHARMEGLINENIALTRSLAAHLCVHPDMDQETFALIASRMIGNNRLIVNFAAAKDLVISHMYPIAGNEAAIGLDYRTVPSQWDDVRKARDLGQTVVAGPVKLVQGGMAFIVRHPVFLDDEIFPDRRFWGIVSLPIRFEAVLQAVGLTENANDLDVAIRSQGADASSGKIFFGDDKIFGSEPVMVSVPFPGGGWEIAAIPNGGWPPYPPGIWTSRIVAGTLAVLVGLVWFFILTFIVDRRLTLTALYRAKEEAIWASNAKTAFLANMSHELRTPLNAIIGFAQVMSAGMFGPIGDKYKEYASDILKSGNHLLAIISDVLEISKVEAGVLDIQAIPVSVDDILEDAVRLLENRAQANNVVLSVTGDDGLTLSVDPTRFKQIVINLLSNAVKFTMNGSVTLISEIHEDWYRLTVADTGIGMSKSELRFALEPFRQIDTEIHKRKPEGTGLGLPLTKMLVEAHGGKLQLLSRVKEGTRVEVWLPPERVIKRAVLERMLDDDVDDGAAG